MHYSSSGGGGGSYHELQNIIKRVPIQCMIETSSWVPKRRFKAKWQQDWDT